MAKKTTLSHSRWEVTLRNLRALKLRIKVLSNRVSYLEKRVRAVEKAKKAVEVIMVGGGGSGRSRR